jgi:hypothetical protein
MAINQISSANTFEQWLIATQQLISFANSITDVGGTFTSNTSEYIITGNLTVGNAVTAPTVNTDVIIFDDGTRLSSNVQIVNGYNHANGAFNKANAANILAQQAYDYANTIALSGEISGDNVVVLYTVTGNNIVANISVSSANVTATSNVTAGNVNASNVITGLNVTATNNVTAGNVNVTNVITAANATITNITATNNVTAGNISVTNAITTTNLSATLITASDVNTTSDMALKDNVEQIENPLEIINKITGLSFNWKSDGIKSYGVSAQEVEQILPEIVRTRSDGYKGVNYLNLIAFLIEAVKELQKEVAKIKNNNK